MNGSADRQIDESRSVQLSERHTLLVARHINVDTMANRPKVLHITVIAPFEFQKFEVLLNQVHVSRSAEREPRLRSAIGSVKIAVRDSIGKGRLCRLPLLTWLNG